MNYLLKSAWLLLCISLLLTSCKKDKDEIEELENNSGSPNTPYYGNNKLKDMVIPDGFAFKTSRAVQFDLNLNDSLGQAVDSVHYTIIGVPDKGEPENLFSGFTAESQNIDLKIDIPIHFEKVVLQTSFDNATKHFEFQVDDLVQDKIAVNGVLSTEAQSRIDNCYPSLQTDFSSSNKSFTISSDQKMNTIEIQYTDGTSEVIRVNATSFNY